MSSGKFPNKYFCNLSWHNCRYLLVNPSSESFRKHRSFGFNQYFEWGHFCLQGVLMLFLPSLPLLLFLQRSFELLRSPIFRSSLFFIFSFRSVFSCWIEVPLTSYPREIVACTREFPSFQCRDSFPPRPLRLKLVLALRTRLSGVFVAISYLAMNSLFITYCFVLFSRFIS